MRATLRYLATMAAPALLAIAPSWSAAQITLPRIIQKTTVPLAVSATPAASGFDVASYLHRLQDVPSNVLRAPSDTIRRAVVAHAQAWLSGLQKTPASGIQLDQLGRVLIRAGNDSAARAQFGKRLASPGLATVDRAYTLLVAVRAFADTTHAERLAIAEQYMTQLAALPADTVGMWMFSARSALVDAYATLEQLDRGREHAIQALSLMPRLPIYEFGPLVETRPMLAMANLVADGPNGREKLDQIIKALEGATQPSAAVVAADSNTRGYAMQLATSLQQFSSIAALLAKPAPAVKTGVVWNSSDSTTKEIPFNDGNTWVVLFGTHTCCDGTIRALQRIVAQAPSGVKAIYVTATAGYWGSRIVTSAEEVELQRKAYLERGKVTLPIALWVSEKQTMPNGWTVPIAGPNMSAFSVPQSYGYQDKPYVLVIDSRGIVRQAYYGFDRSDESNVLSFVTASARPSSSAATQ